MGTGCSSGSGKYLQNSRGDVVGVQERDRYNADLTLRYTVYGYPELLLSNDPYNTGDFNGDGDWGDGRGRGGLLGVPGGDLLPDVHALGGREP